MNSHQVLFLGDNCNTTALWLAGLHELRRAYSIAVANRQLISTHTASSFDLILIEVEGGTMLEVLETCRRLRSRTNAPILCISSIDDEDSALELYEAGANEYIVKPISLNMLHAKLEAWRRWIVPTKEQLSLSAQDMVMVI
jgi:DNA-binding response OmpR family regulator